MISVQILRSIDKECDDLYEFFQSSIYIGQSHSNDLIISDIALQKKHLKLYFENNSLIVLPVKKEFDYLLNGKKCLGARSIKVNDIIAVGQTIFKIIAYQYFEDIPYKKLAQDSAKKLVETNSPALKLLELLQDEIIALESTKNAE